MPIGIYTAPKQHPLDVEKISEFEGLGSIMGYYSKGHHEPAPFLEAVKKEFLEDDSKLTSVKAEQVKQGYIRFVPSGDAGMVIYFYKYWGVGSSTVTYFEY